MVRNRYHESTTLRSLWGRLGSGDLTIKILANHAAAVWFILSIFEGGVGVQQPYGSSEANQDDLESPTIKLWKLDEDKKLKKSPGLPLSITTNNIVLLLCRKHARKLAFS